MKKINRVLCFLLAAITVLSLSACKESMPVMFTFKDMTMSSGMFAFALAERKGQVVDYYSSYNGVDISSDEKFWNQLNGEKTLAESLKEYTVELCKNILIADYYCKQFGLKIEDETAIEELDGFMQNAIDNFGGEDELALELAKYGMTIEQLRDYYSYYYKYQLLLNYWYGENGTMKIPAAEVRDRLINNYYKVDTAFFSYNTTDENYNSVPYVDKSITDAQAKEYFNKNYVKVQHILYMTVDTNEKPLSDEEVAKAKQEAQETYDAIKAGRVNFDDKMKEKSDSSAEMLFTYGEMESEFEKASFEMKTDEVRLVETKYGWHIIKKLATTDSDFGKKEDEVRETMSKEKIAASANEMFEQIKAGKTEFKEGGDNALYKFASGSVIAKASTDANTQKIIEAIESINVGEYKLLEIEDQGYYIIRKSEFDDTDLSNYYSTIEDEMKQEKYFAYMETFYDSVTVNQEELAKYDNIPAVQSFPLFTY